MSISDEILVHSFVAINCNERRKNTSSCGRLYSVVENVFKVLLVNGHIVARAIDSQGGNYSTRILHLNHQLKISKLLDTLSSASIHKREVLIYHELRLNNTKNCLLTIFKIIKRVALTVIDLFVND